MGKKLDRYKAKVLKKRVRALEVYTVTKFDDVKADLEAITAKSAEQQTVLDNLTGDITRLTAAEAAAQLARAALQAQIDEILASGMPTPEQMTELATKSAAAKSAQELVTTRMAELAAATPEPDPGTP